MKQEKIRPKILLVAPFLRSILGSGKADSRVPQFLEVLGACCDVSLLFHGHSPDGSSWLAQKLKRGHIALVSSDAAALSDLTVRSAAQSAYAAVVFVDGGAVRAALDDVKKRTGLPAALAIFPDDFPGAWPRPSCTPDALWCFSKAPPTSGTEGLLPGAFDWSPRPESARLARQIDALCAGRRGGPIDEGKLASIIIPCWNGLPYLKDCLKSVSRWTREPYEIIIVDNGSAAPTRRFLDEWGRRKGERRRLIRNSSNLGFTKAINQGMKAAKGRYLVWLNTDAVATPRWLERLADCARRAPWIGAVGPLTNNEKGELNAASRKLVFSLKRTAATAEALALQNAGRASAAYWLAGFCFLLKREAFERVGLLDERFGTAFYEDYDYCLRLRQAGYEVVVAEDAFVYHHWHKSFESEAGRLRQETLNRQIWIDKWGRRAFEFLGEIMAEQAPGKRIPPSSRRGTPVCVQTFEWKPGAGDRT
jgi:GT2 family glycosyltransferase